jgi:hypothetical protein
MRRGSRLPRLFSTAICVVVVAAAAVSLLFATAGAMARARVRFCGSAPSMAYNRVWATRSVTCEQARSLMHNLLGGSGECYPNGPTSHSRCVLEGFHCSAYPVGRHSTRGNCVNHRKHIHGFAEA